jgi:hypothetical protein
MTTVLWEIPDQVRDDGNEHGLRRPSGLLSYNGNVLIAPPPPFPRTLIGDSSLHAQNDEG